MTEQVAEQATAGETLQARNGQWQAIVGFVVFLLIVAGLMIGGYALIEKLTDADEMPLTGMIIQGERRYISDEDVRQAILNGEVGSFFTADVDELRFRLEALPWVYSASIRKEWPQRLRVYLVEQEPFAVWNDEAFINQQGQVFAAEVNELAEVLPHLLGPADAAAEVITQYQRISEILRIYQTRVTRLELSERFAVSAWLENGIEIRLGREARLERVQRFMDLYPVIAAEEPDKAIAYADLRYDTGIAIGWKDKENNE
ncbi:MAG: cell division protein FtsQ/DivIB [Aliidiomarina sp.]|uniref:cell division protein FtsQ/DivIB n=1 Tax=Aliidiomarina sp. TaxID=1872439 RepID=UPI0025BD21BA|nr:cell division protein FtsQ/DivIB [Aliidiomarina sp.]MCH8501288.1 cell division protein FtsQ/DivIB [Aliidiomarina sp.]